MTAETGERNGKINGSTVDSEAKRDMKDEGNGGEVGGSFVIVNGDSSDHSDRDLDAEGKKLDPKSKEESRANEEDLVNGDEKLSEENGSGSDIKVEEGREIETEEKLDFDAQLAPEEVEGDNVKELEIGKEETLEAVTGEEENSDAQLEGVEVEGDDIKEQEIGKEETLVFGSGSEVKIVHEEEEKDANDETVVQKDLGSIVEPETVITETGRLEESTSASPVEEEEKPVSDEDVEEGQKTVHMVGETENSAEIDSAVEAEPKPGTPTVVEETDNSVEVEPEQEPDIVVEDTENSVEVEQEKEPGVVVEEAEKLAAPESAVIEVELDKEPNTGVEDSETVADLGSAVEVELKQGMGMVVEEMDKSEVEKKDDNVVVEENNSQDETGSAVEVEPAQEPETVPEAADKVEAEEETKEPEEVVAVSPSYKHILLRVSPIQNADVNAPRNESSGQVDAETSGVKDELNDETRNINLEGSDILHVAQNELVEEVSSSNDDVQLEVSYGDIVPSESTIDTSSEVIEPRSSGSVPSADRDVQAEELCPNKDTEAETKDSITDVETNEDVAAERLKVESESVPESDEGSESVVSTIEGDQSTSKDDEEEPSHEQSQVAETIQAPPETRVVKRHRVYMIKVPRFIDDELQKKILDASKIVEEKTNIRDSIGKDIQKKMGDVRKSSLNYHAVLAEEKSVRGSINAIRQKMERVQESINRINNANSIADLDEKIRQMVHRQQHETMSLKQEKQYISDIKQMKRLREQLSLRKAPQEQIEEALNQRDEIETQFKDLKKQLDSQRAALLSAESKTKSARKEYGDEDQCLKKLKEKYNVADGVRQEAYLELRKLRNQATEKARHFKMFKADELAAKNYMFSGDNQGLRSHCNKQVENIMNLWNNNVEFREQYVKSNFNSTVRRLETADGRALGPGEKAPILQSYADKRSNIVSAPSSSIETSAPVSESEVRQGNLTEPSAIKQALRKDLSTKSISSTKSEGSVPTVSSSEESKEEEKNNKLTKEEEELARKAEELARKEAELRKEKAAKEEELRKQKALAEKKEQLKLEQKAKAKEAEERKRRKAEKAQAKAEYRAKKEAELKEQKKAKKNKKSSTTDTTNVITERETTPDPETTTTSENFQEPESSSVAASRKRSSKPVSSTRQFNKVQAPVPLPLRNRSKRKMKTWMWVSLAVLLVLALFVAGNYISFSTSSLPSFNI
ncbi:uncharacterized protein A4U43_C01F33780 [Asparagus officinalis]|uniref:Uncharacterized protein n=1 Tax=Asparagus officinalis TaxID=4686 RepID=A0A5P1FWA5_ASPOF|nr:myosin-2 heavy chain-like [Asparagus officinalis]ONK81877.1 uncharacterized protein A4U43_C01F33780 [Asparagus officinalis]